MRRTPYAFAFFLLLLLFLTFGADAQNWSHYGGNARTYMDVGLGMGQAMVELFEQQ